MTTFYWILAAILLFTRIAGDKQLGVSLAAPSVPLLPQLQTGVR
jgi:hypothetical protein